MPFIREVFYKVETAYQRGNGSSLLTPWQIACYPLRQFGNVAQLPREVRVRPEVIKGAATGKHQQLRHGTKYIKQGSGAEDSFGPHSGRPVLLWSTMKIWIVCFHF